MTLSALPENAFLKFRAKNPLILRLENKRCVELVEDGHALLDRAASGEGADTGFGIELGDAASGEFLDKFVHAD